MRSKVFAILIIVAFMCLVAAAPAQAQRGRGGQQIQLPEGLGQQLIQSQCTQCHGLNQIVNSSGYGEDDWELLVSSMVALPDAQAHTVAQYLAAHFPEQPGRRPTLISGDASIEFTEWMVPTLGQRSRDPVEAPDGSIWCGTQHGVVRFLDGTFETMQREMEPADLETLGARLRGHAREGASCRYPPTRASAGATHGE